MELNNKTQLPCANCGLELAGHPEADITMETEESDEYTFLGRPARVDVASITCPDCGKVTEV